MDVRLAATLELTTEDLVRIRRVCDVAFGERDDPRPAHGEAFTDEDFDHALGGVHAIGVEGAEIVGHASWVERELHVAGVPIATGYVEAVAVLPELQRRGLGTRVMGALTRDLRRRFPLGALDTSKHAFYERLGWERWRGPTSVWTTDGDRPTPEEDGYVMILRTPTSPPLDLDAPISCDRREGDVW